jgi:hypothetical protein
MPTACHHIVRGQTGWLRLIDLDGVHQSLIQIKDEQGLR